MLRRVEVQISIYHGTIASSRDQDTIPNEERRYMIGN